MPAEKVTVQSGRGERSYRPGNERLAKLWAQDEKLAAQIAELGETIGQLKANLRMEDANGKVSGHLQDLEHRYQLAKDELERIRQSTDLLTKATGVSRYVYENPAFARLQKDEAFMGAYRGLHQAVAQKNLEGFTASLDAMLAADQTIRDSFSEKDKQLMSQHYRLYDSLVPHDIGQLRAAFTGIPAEQLDWDGLQEEFGVEAK